MKWAVFDAVTGQPLKLRIHDTDTGVTKYEWAVRDSRDEAVELRNEVFGGHDDWAETRMPIRSVDPELVEVWGAPEARQR